MSVVELKVPTIGESVTEVTLSAWLKEDGAYVAMDENICEFESDKATLEFPAEVAGKLIHVAAEGDDLEIGALVAKIDTSVSAEGGNGASPSGGDASNAETGQQEESPAPEPQAEKASAGGNGQPEPARSETYATGHPSPAAAKILREHDIDPQEVKGTGRDGRITKEDALQAVENRQAPKQEPQQKTPAASPEVPASPASGPPATQPGERHSHRKKMSRMRRTIARRLVSAKNETAMLTTFNEVDMSAVIALRKKYQEKFVERYGIKLGFMSIFAKACAKALMDMPDVNAFIDGNELIYHDFVDISIAISTPNGLVVPPVRNVESLHFAEIERKIKDLADKARNGTLSLDDMAGGTFTITNGGIFGSMLSTPILNEPQSAILGMHNIVERPVAVQGEVVVRPVMYVALSYDHRVIDGSTSVTFLVKVKEYLEDPTLMFLDI